jgi:hypothetical protein
MKEKISVLMPTSPIASHPSTAIIAETISSVRKHLPNAPIFIMADGVRKEQAAYTDRYVEYLHKMVGHAMLNMNNIKLIPFMEFTHQAWMTVRALEKVETPFVLFVEHDTPLMDRPIDWEMLKTSISSGHANHIRLHYDEEIHLEHEYLLRGKLTGHLLKTVQYSQRPHLADTLWYRELLAANFNENSRTFIEDKVYGVVSEAPWEKYRLAIYDPNGNGKEMKRSRDLNGRAADPKYSMVF